MLSVPNSMGSIGFARELGKPVGEDQEYCTLYAKQKNNFLSAAVRVGTYGYAASTTKSTSLSSDADGLRMHQTTHGNVLVTRRVRSSDDAESLARRV